MALISTRGSDRHYLLLRATTRRRGPIIPAPRSRDDIDNPSALPSDDLVLRTNNACAGCKKGPVHCLKDGRWRSKPGNKFDDIKSPRPITRDDVAAAKTLLSQVDTDELACKVIDKLILMAQDFESSSAAGSSDHNASSSDPNAISDDEIIDS